MSGMVVTLLIVLVTVLASALAPTFAGCQCGFCKRIRRAVHDPEAK